MVTTGSSAIRSFRPADRITRAADVIWRRVDDEIVVLNEDGTTLTTLNVTASIAWEAMDGARSIDEVAQRVSERFDVPHAEVLADVLELCDGLREAGLVLVAGTGDRSEPDGGPRPA
jgi:hypothetical protein